MDEGVLGVGLTLAGTLGTARTIDEVRVRTATLERNLDRPRFYVLLMPASDVPAHYQLTLAARRW